MTKIFKHLSRRYNSSWFKCTSCGYTTQMLVLGNTAICPKCGGRANRC